jgi:two-component system nitrogen regulation response regulator GlnG
MAVGRKVVEGEAMRVLTNYEWPGNTRELENMVKSLMITNVKGTITLDSLPKNLFTHEFLLEAKESLEEVAFEKLEQLVKNAIESNKNLHLLEVISQVERPLIRLLLQYTNWNQQRTAKILGINRNTLRKKIKSLGLK